MKHSFSVIGSNFGDEGKGATVNLISSLFKKHTEHTQLNIKVNGGCQAGHTVEHLQHRHVFHQIGSATMQGVDTLISQHCILNFAQLNLETYQLHLLGFQPAIYVHEDCLLSIPYDEIINQSLELSRSNRHGSCGFGINETVTRSQHPKFSLTLRQLINLNGDELYDLFKNIREEYFPVRINEMSLMDGVDIEALHHQLNNHHNINDAKWIAEFFESFHLFKLYATILDNKAVGGLLQDTDVLIFEHSQGLLLDQNNHRMFPHLTRSNTGSTNVTSIFNLYELDKDLHQNVYVTRPYLTRHGAGPLPNLQYVDTMSKSFIITDDTNIDNLFQGSIQAVPMDVNLFHNTIIRDINDTKPHLINITCMDQCISNVIPVTIDQTLQYIPLTNMLRLLSNPSPEHQLTDMTTYILNIVATTD